MTSPSDCKYKPIHYSSHIAKIWCTISVSFKDSIRKGLMLVASGCRYGWHMPDTVAR